MATQAIMMKVKWNKGVLENGQSYDYTRVTLQMPIYDQSSNEFGVDTLECEYGTEALHTDLLQYRGKLPMQIECDIFQAMKRGKAVHIISNIRPVQAIRQTKPE